MEGATLVIEFRDQSGPRQGGSQVPQAGGTTPAWDGVAKQQDAITQAGGVRSVVRGQEQVAPVTVTTAQGPPVSATPPSFAVSTAPSAEGVDERLMGLVSRIVAQDPRATADEIARALGMRQSEAEAALRALQGTQQTSQTFATQQTVPAGDLVTATRQLWDGMEQRDLAQRRALDTERLVAGTQQTWADQAAAERMRQEEQERARRPPPAPMAEPPQIPGLPGAPPIEAEAVDTSGQVQATVGALSHFAHMFGPMGSAAAGVVNTALLAPGVAQGLGNAAPALVGAAPYVALAGAVAAVPAVAAYTVESIAQRARSQATGLSVELAQAEAVANVRQFMANVQTAERLGDELSRFVDARSRIGAASQGIRDVLFEPVLNKFDRALEGMAAVLETANKVAQVPGAGTAANVGTNLAWELSKMIPVWSRIAEGLDLLGALGNLGKAGPEAIPGVKAGLMGIIPPRPSLPAPFAPDNASAVHIQMPTPPAAALGGPGL